MDEDTCSFCSMRATIVPLAPPMFSFCSMRAELSPSEGPRNMIYACIPLIGLVFQSRTHIR